MIHPPCLPVSPQRPIPPHSLARLLKLAALSCLLLPAALPGQTLPAPLVIDASAPTPAPGPANYTYDPADARSP